MQLPPKTCLRLTINSFSEALLRVTHTNSSCRWYRKDEDTLVLRYLYAYSGPLKEDVKRRWLSSDKDSSLKCKFLTKNIIDK